MLERLLVLLACTVLAVSAHAEPHPLSRINLRNIRTQLDGVSAAHTLAVSVRLSGRLGY